MSNQKLVYTAHKAYAGAGASFVAMLFAPVGAEPHQTYTILVLLSSLFSPWTGMPIDAELLRQAVKGLWVAMMAGAGVHQAVYWTPNQLKEILPMVGKLLAGIAAPQPGAGYQPEAQAAAPGEPSRTSKAPPATLMAFGLSALIGAVLLMALPRDAQAMGTLAAESIAPFAAIGWLALAVVLVAVLLRRRLAALACTLAFALALGGCASDDMLKNSGLNEGDLQSLATNGKGPMQEAADKLFGEAVGLDHRGVRLCMIGSGVIEAMVDRVANEDTSYASTAAGQIMRVKNLVANLDLSATNIWFETDLKIVTLQLAEVLVDGIKDRVPRLVSNFAGAINPLGLAKRAGVIGRQGALAEAIVLDVRRTIMEIADGKLSVDDAKAGCLGRIEKNEKRIAAILGG